MNSLWLRGTRTTKKNSFYFYIRAVNNLKLTKKTIPFTTAPKRIKYLRMELTSAKLLHQKSQTLLKEIKKYLEKQKRHHIHGLKDNSFKMKILPNVIYRFKTIPIKSPATFFYVETDNLISKLMWECKGPHRNKTILKKKKVRGLALPKLKTDYQLQ